MNPGRILQLTAQLLLSIGAVAASRRCWSRGGVVGTCQTAKACGISNSFIIVLAIRTRRCFWSGGKPYICCSNAERDLSLKRRFWYGFTRGRQNAKTTTASSQIESTASTTTARPSSVVTTPSPSHPTPPTNPRPTVRPPRAIFHILSPSASDPSALRPPIGAASVPAPPKHLRPPPPQTSAFDVDQLEEKEEEVLKASEKDMPTVEPFPMEHEEDESKNSVSTPGDVESICGRADPVVVADQKYIEILRKAFPDVKPAFSVPGGVYGKEARVAGGFSSVEGRWPWMAMLGKMEGSDITWLCGGSIIDQYHVLTAAHCVLERPNIVRVGDHNIDVDLESDDDSELHEIAKLTLHPEYRPPRSYHDIAVITLRRALVFSRFVRPICLPPADLRLRRGMTAKITGHGVREFNGGALTARLQEAQIQLVRRKFCNASYARLGRAFFEKYPGGVLSHMLCAGDKKGGVDACQGDSGGPLVQHNDATDAYHQIGVISSGFGCGNPEFPGLYVSVRHHLSFIEAVMCSHWTRASSGPHELIRPRSAGLSAPGT